MEDEVIKTYTNTAKKITIKKKEHHENIHLVEQNKIHHSALSNNPPKKEYLLSLIFQSVSLWWHFFCRHTVN